MNGGQRLPPPEVASINVQFREEQQRFDLRYRCGDCIHLLRPGVTCGLGYPNEELASGEVRALDEGGRFLFCKDFELEDG